MTLDLTVPEEPIKQESRPSVLVEDASVWLNPMLGRVNRQEVTPVANTTAPEFRTAGKGGRNETGEENRSGVLPRQADELFDSSDLQILGLESKKPVISYCGRLFQCEWSENIGSELLFVRRKEDGENLPSIKHLPGDVDLLCVNSARLVSEKLDTERVKRTLNKELRRQLARRYDNRLTDPDVASQAYFLDNLAAQKRDKGEEDLVSVLVEGRPHNRDWRRWVERRHADERAYWEDVLEHGHDEDELEDAVTRLEEMDEEDKTMLSLNEKNRRIRISRERKTLKRAPVDDGRNPKILRKKGPDGNWIEVLGPLAHSHTPASGSEGSGREDDDEGTDEDRNIDEDEDMEVVASDADIMDEDEEEDGTEGRRSSFGEIYDADEDDNPA